ncbi:type VII toxin-antitoxin system HepT family RNase toxin [Candidatus Lokiarchaeum ossiferum]|uniref:type VII toxin-antitoxin system HepT family RNase toxin n=1 Tax=Candidatus Lokiarchaeum ossiferum TaxID=2951803 RepID=UPI00352E5761
MDKTRLMLKIRELKVYLEELEELLPDDEASYLKSLEKRRSVERELQIMIECMVDICMLLLKELKLGPPQNEENVLDLLSGKITNIPKLKEMRGFRNILVQKYGKIKDPLVFFFASNEREDFLVFIKDVKELMK